MFSFMRKKPNSEARLNVLVIGGGIAGLAAAYTIQKGGHRVTVLEDRATAYTGRGALRSPPNMSRILNTWGLDKFLHEKGVFCDACVFLEANQGELLGRATFHSEFLAELMAGYYNVQHADLHKALTRLAEKEGAKIRHSSGVKDISSDPVSVTLSTGEVLTADLIIGADGAKSQVRATILEDELFGQPEPHEDLIFHSFVVPAKECNDPDLKFFQKSLNWGFWLGDGYQVGIAPVHGQKEVTITTLMSNVPNASEICDSTWDEEDLTRDKTRRIHVEPKLDKLIHKAKKVTRVPWTINQPLFESMTDDSGRIVLVGDAAHPMTPSGSYTAALAIEDAELLGRLLSRIQNRNQLHHFTSAYEELRTARIREVHDWEYQKISSFLLHKGEDQEARDAGYKMAMVYDEYEALDEETFGALWGPEVSKYVYNARDEADDWWTKWGPILSRE